MNIKDAIAGARNSAQRKFRQGFDLSVNIKGLDMKKPDSKISREIALPHGMGKEPQICLISDNIDFENRVGKADIIAMEADKKSAKGFVRKFDFFICEAPLMVQVGKSLGKYLGPVGRMPRVLPPNADPAAIAEELKKSVRLRVRDSPVVHCRVGSEEMSDEQVEDNVRKVLDELKKALPAKAQIRNAYLKLTMGKAVKIDSGM